MGQANEPGDWWGLNSLSAIPVLGFINAKNSDVRVAAYRDLVEYSAYVFDFKGFTVVFCAR